MAATGDPPEAAARSNALQATAMPVASTSPSTEKALTEIWAQILGQRVGAHESFIDFTDSLSAAEYVNHVRDAFNVDISVDALFDKVSNVSKLAALIDQLAGSGAQGQAALDTVPVTASAPIASRPQAASDDWALALPGGQWRVWRTVALRAAGFPASMLAPLISERTAEAADQFLAARQEVHRERTVVLREIGTLARAADPITRTALRRARRRVRQGVARADGPLESETGLAAAFARRSAAASMLAAAHHADVELVTTRLVDLLANGRLREAALWQNRDAFRLASTRLLDGHGSPGDRRNAAAFIAMLVQRYAAKNDSLGFFGPVGWARFIDDDLCVEVTPGPTLLARREVYFEGWAIDALADALDKNPALKPWTTPRVTSGVWIGPEHVVVPVTGSVAVSAAQRSLLVLSDGTRTAREIAAAAMTQNPPVADSESVVFDMLHELVERQLLSWRLEVPSQLYPEHDLANRLKRIGDAAVRADCETALRTLVDAKARVGAAAGNHEALEPALADLDAAFTRITGHAPTRRHGEMYAARTLVFEDCRRDCEVGFGRELLARLGPPLSLVLDGARWVSAELRAEFTRQLRACHAHLRAALRSDTVDAHLFMNYVGSKGRELTGPISQRILDQFQQRWRWIISRPLDAQRLTLGVGEVEARAREAFAAQGASSWGGYFCPDVMVASPSLSALQQGQFHCVLGEIHSNNTLLWSALVSQHPHVESIQRALAEDTQDQTMLLVQTPKARWVSRLNVTTLSTFWRYEHGDDPPSLPSCRSLPAALLVAADDGQSVRISARDGRVEFDAYDLFAITMSYEADRIVSAMLRSGAHAPRVTIGDLTVSREQWQATPAEMPFLRETDPHLTFAGMREWGRARGMPRHVFYKSAGETKPCYLDFDSALYVSVFTKLMRRLRGTASVRIVEMLPAIGEVWLPDREDARYTSEIRIVARQPA
jgi:hypothetical protein